MRLLYIQCQNLSRKFKSSDYEAYDSRYLKKLLKDSYASHISFSEELGKEALICLIDMINFIINKNFREKTQEINTESERIIKTAATLIKTEIRDRSYSNDFYTTKKKYKAHGFQIIIEHS